MVSKQNQYLPIALQKKYVDKRLVFMPYENPPDDPSGSVVFSKQGFFEIPSEKNKPSKFTSKKEYVMESYYKDFFSELPLVKNFFKRKLLNKWLLVTRSNHFKATKWALSENFWGAHRMYAKHFPSVKSQLVAISEMRGVSLEENLVYGKRQTQFAAKQKSHLQELTKVFDGCSKTLVETLEQLSRECEQVKADQKQEMVNKLITERLQRRKDPFVGLNRTQKETQSPEKKYDFLSDSFLGYVRVAYFHSVIDSVESTYQKVKRTICGQRKPRFEHIVYIDEEIGMDPDIDEQKELVLNSIQNFKKHLLDTSGLAFFHSCFHSLVKFRHYKLSYTDYIKDILEKDSKSHKCFTEIENQVTKDVETAKKYVMSFKHLEEVKQEGQKWLGQVRSLEFDALSFYRENYKKCNAYSEQIEEIPNFNSISGVITIETASLRNELLVIPRTVTSALRERLLGMITQESSELRSELMKQHKVLEEKSSTLPGFIEQVRALKLQKEQLQNWESKLTFIKECMSLCRRQSLSIPANLSSSVEECSSIIKSFPCKFQGVEAHYEEYKGFFEDQLDRNSAKLGRKIKKFETKYVERYLKEPERLQNTSAVVNELEKREEALATMKQRVEAFEDFEKELSSVRGASAKELQCRKDFELLFALHCDTLKLWKLVGFWRTRMNQWLTTPFQDLNVFKMAKKLSMISERLRPDCYSSVLFLKTSESIAKVINEEISELLCMCDTLKDLKSEALKPRHWEIILKMIRKPHLMNQPFTLKELKECSISLYSSKISQITQEAKAESDHESLLSEIKDFWSQTKIQTESYKDRLDNYVISDTREIEEGIEEHMLIIEKLRKNFFLEHILVEVEEWKEKLETMKTVLGLWLASQKSWLELLPIFGSEKIQDNLPDQFENFKDLQLKFKKTVWTAQENPNACFNLLVANRQQLFCELVEGFSEIRKHIKDFLEARRANFARFFFMSDLELLEFLSGVHSHTEYDKHLSCIFPGAKRLYITEVPESQGSPCMDSFPFNFFSPAASDLIDPFEFSEEQAVVPADTQNSLQIKGFVGLNGELLLFEQGVEVHENAEDWLTEVEVQMKESLSKAVGFAVATFPKLSLDEWVLDYSQQTVISAINLIITHEITELFEENNLSEKDSDSETLVDPEEPLPEVFEEHFSKVFFASVGETNSMNESKEFLMQYLQSKTLKGLCLRLQFWVNQIVKSVTCDRDSVNRLSPANLVVLRSLVHFLCYERDAVSNLAERSVIDANDFEWQKNVRTYWDPEKNFCSIECGGFKMIQGTEYLGTSYRMLCSPLTTKYFLYLSGAIRETSSLVFRTNTSEETISEFFEEFSSICGVSSKSIYLSTQTEMEFLMQCLNGVALTSTWANFEHLDNLSMKDFQVLMKEIQMIQQQFLIAETVEESGVSVKKLEKSSLIEKSDTSLKYNYSELKVGSVDSVFVVMGSLSPKQNLPDSLLESLKTSFRSIELYRPDIGYIAAVALIREGFRHYRPLSESLETLSKLIVEKLGDHIGMSRRDTLNIVVLAKRVMEKGQDLQAAESTAVIRAVRMFLSERFRFKLEKVDSVLDECIKKSFKFKLRQNLQFQELRNELEQACHKLLLEYQDFQVDLAQELYLSLKMSKVTVVVGEEHCGKSTIVSILSTALESLNQVPIKKVVFNPNLFTPEELLGTTENETPLFEKICCEDNGWLVLECQKLQRWYSDSLLGLMQNSPLTMSESKSLDPKAKTTEFLSSKNVFSHVRVDFPVILEVSDISSASPFFVSQVSLLPVKTQPEWQCIARLGTEESWLRMGVSSELLRATIEKHFRLLEKLNKHFKHEWNMYSLTFAFKRVLRSFVQEGVLKYGEYLDQKEGLASLEEIKEFIRSSESFYLKDIKSRLETAVVLGIVWSYGVSLAEPKRKEFIGVLKTCNIKISIPLEEVFEHWMNWENVKFKRFIREESLAGVERALYLCSQLPGTHFGLSGEGASLAVGRLDCEVFTLKPQVDLKHLQNKLLGVSCVVVEDLHLDQVYNKGVSEAVKTWMKWKGYYDSSGDFRSLKNLTFVLTGSSSSWANPVYVDAPSTSYFKEKLINSVYNNQLKISSLVQRYLGMIASAWVKVKKELQTKECNFNRLLLNFTRMVNFSKNLEVQALKTIKEEELVCQVIKFELRKTLRDALKEKKVFDTKLKEVLQSKFGVNLQSNAVFGNYLLECPPKFNMQIKYKRFEDSNQIQQALLERVPRMGKFSLHRNNLENILSLSRSLHTDDMHTFVLSPSGQGIYECIQVACFLRGARVIEPSSERFAQSFQNALVSVLHNIKSHPHTVILIQHYSDFSYLDLVHSFIANEDFLWEEYSKRIELLEKERLPKKGSKDLVQSGLNLIRKYLHLVVVVEEVQVMDELLKRYPLVLEKCDVIREKSHLDFGELTLLGEKFLYNKGFDSVLADRTVELFLYVKSTIDNFNQKQNFSNRNIGEAKQGEFISVKRLFEFLELFSEMFYRRKAALQTKKKQLTEVYDTLRDLERLHEKSVKNMPNLQQQTMQTNSSIKQTKDRTQELTGKIEAKQQFIETKLQQLANLTEELNSIQQENNQLLTPVEHKITQSYQAFKKYDFEKSNFVGTLKLVSGAESREAILKALEERHFGEFPQSVSSKLFETAQEYEATEMGFLDKTVFEYIFNLAKRLQLVKVIRPQIAKAKETAKQIEDTKTAVETSRSLVERMQKELEELRVQEEKFKENLSSQKEPLKDSEIAHIRTNQIISSVNQLTQKTADQLEAVMEQQEKVHGDCLIFTTSVVLLNVFPLNYRAEIRSSLAKVLENNQIMSSEIWHESHSKFFKDFLELLGFKTKFPKILEPSSAYEALLTYHFSKFCLFVDESGELKKALPELTEEPFISVKCSARTCDSQLESAKEAGTQVFLSDFNPEPEKCDLDSWKIGGGYCQQSFHLKTLWEDNLEICENNSFKKGVYIWSGRKVKLPKKFWNTINIEANTQLQTQEAQLELKQLFLESLLPSEYQEFCELHSVYLEAKQNWSLLKEQKKNAILQCNEESLKNYQFYTETVKIVEQAGKAYSNYLGAQQALKQFMEQYPVLLKYSEHTYLVYSALKDLAALLEGNSYSWSHFKEIVKCVLVKSLRDQTMDLNNSSAEEQVSIDEDFFARKAFLGICFCAVGGVHQHYSSLFYLMLALKVSCAEGVVSQKYLERFGELFLKFEGCMQWMKTLDAYKSEVLSFEELESTFSSVLGGYKSYLEELKAAVEEGSLQERKNIPVEVRLLAAVHFPNSTLKSLLRQFIFETLNQVLAYEEELPGLHTFIKTASWHYPIAVHSLPGVNLVNTLCSLANYYSVGMEVIRTDPEDSSETVSLIVRSAKEGTWVLVSTQEFPSFWNQLSVELRSVRASISNTFRLFFDLQGLNHYQVPDSFLQEESVSFYVSHLNSEEIEGYNDVWSNMLYQEVLGHNFSEAF